MRAGAPWGNNAAMAVDVETLSRIALSFPGVEEAVRHGTRAFVVRKAFLGRLRDGDSVLALKLSGLDERDLLIEADPATFFVTDHYRAYPYVLIRLAAAAPEQVETLFGRAWRGVASKRLIAEYEAR